MSNIYYKEKAITNPFSSKIITVENIEKLFKLKESGIGYNNDKIPFSSFYWESKEKFYDDKNMGRVYIPKNIFMTDGKKNYVIVLIDKVVELRSLPEFRNESKTWKEKMANIPHVSSPEEISAIEKSFAYLIEQTGVNKTLEERFAHVKGILIKKSDVKSLLQLIVGDQNFIEAVSEKIYQAAKDPVLFYKRNEKYIEKIASRPTKSLYLQVLIHELRKKNKCYIIDFKAEAEDVSHAVSKLTKEKMTIKLDNSHENLDGLGLLKIVDKKLRESDLLLMDIYEDSDAYDIILVPIKNCEQLKKAGEKCKIEINEI